MRVYICYIHICSLSFFFFVSVLLHGRSYALKSFAVFFFLAYNRFRIDTKRHRETRRKVRNRRLKSASAIRIERNLSGYVNVSSYYFRYYILLLYTNLVCVRVCMCVYVCLALCDQCTRVSVFVPCVYPRFKPTSSRSVRTDRRTPRIEQTVIARNA